MTDVFEMASNQETQTRADALAHRETERARLSVRAPRGLAPAGERVCLGCDEVIDPRRIAAEPNAERCTGCESAREARP